MPEIQAQPVIELDLGEHGNRLVFKTPDELRQWNAQELSQWQWLPGVHSPMINQVWAEHQSLHNQLNNYFNEWNNARERVQEVNRILAQIKSIIEERYKSGKILNSTSPAAAFIFALKSKRSPAIAAGAYEGLVFSKYRTGGESRAEVFEGMIEAFLYEREIDWTASAHQQAFDRLRSQYEREGARQEVVSKELEQKNRVLNEEFSEALKGKTDALEKLHQDKATEFTKLTEAHDEKLKAIERTYDQKLALQKPVKYWETKEVYHRRKAKWVGTVAFVAGLLAVGALSWLAYWTLAKLQPNENPKHWHVGVLLVGAFFAVWLVRVFVRLFFSHAHLATDAAERRMMILTYLAMSRQGTQFTPEDKILIVQHIFRSASDGLVRDDAAPPNVLELLTRK